MARVLITGATGFLGRHCLELLHSAGDEVHAVTHSPHSDNTLESLYGVRWHHADLLDPADLQELVAAVQATHLLHLAWYVAPGKYWSAPENSMWLRSSVELLEEFRKCGGERVVMAGTCAEYDWDYGYCSEALTPLRPVTLYGACKHALQTTLSAYAEATGLSAAWGRCFLTYGPYEYPERLIPSVIRSLLRGEPARCSHGNQVRDLLYVKDLADAFVALLFSELTGPINIASGRPQRLKDVVLAIAGHLGQPHLIELGAIAAAPRDPSVLIADVTRLSTELKWSPRRDFNAGLEDTIAWWRACKTF